MIIHPQNSFTIVRQIANHLDMDTNYVRAVIRNAYTDAIIETLNLDAKGAQRFSKNWQVPADPSGAGFYVSIVTSVYTDSGYTSKNPNYGDEETTYLVQDPIPPGRGAGTLGISDVRRIIREELDNLPKPQPFDYDRLPKPQEWKDRTDEILTAVRGIDTKADTISQKEADLSPVLSKLDEALSAIREKEVTPATDLSPVLDRIADHQQENALTADELKDGLGALEEKLTTTIQTTVQKAIEGTEFVSTFATAAKPRKKAQEDEEAQQIDISRITQ